jgi:hypothetical protein
VGFSPKNKCNNARIYILESAKNKRSPTYDSADREWKPPTQTRCCFFSLLSISAYSPSESLSAALSSALTTAMLKWASGLRLRIYATKFAVHAQHHQHVDFAGAQGRAALCRHLVRGRVSALAEADGRIRSDRALRCRRQNHQPAMPAQANANANYKPARAE